eukprot:1430373-Pyramimonas_sp.AAC.1
MVSCNCWRGSLRSSSHHWATHKLHASLNCLGHRAKPIWAPAALATPTRPSGAANAKVVFGHREPHVIVAG